MCALILALALSSWGVGAPLAAPRDGGQTAQARDDSALATIWVDHRELTIASLAVFVAQALTIGGLMINRRRRIALEQLLLKSEDRSRAHLDQALEHKRQYEEGLELLLDLNQRAGQMTERQICDLAVDLAVKTTKSAIGYLHYLNDDQNTIALGAWNAAALEHCSVAHESHYPLASAGIWADSARTRRPVIHNDYQGMPDKKSCPDGHAHLLRHMSVPVIDGDRVRMIIGVGNKAGEYVDEDARQLQLLANEVQKIVMRRRAEQALHESEARFRFITDLSPGLVWVSGTDKLCTWFNKTWLAFTGRSLEQELGNGWAQGVHPEDLAACLASYASRFDAREPFVMEYRLRRHDGEYRWMLDIGQPRRDEDGRFMGYVGTCLDITEQKRTADTIRESRNLLQRVIDSTPDWVFVKDREHRFMLVNEHFARALNQTPESMVGRRDTDFIAAEGRKGDPDKGLRGIHDDDDAVFSGQTIHDPCDRTYFGDGALRVFDTFKGPLRDSSQNIYGVLCFRRDITARFNTEREQQVLERQLQQAQKMELIGHLTGGIAHDFNNILASMFGYAELVQMSPDIQKNPQLSLYLQEILQAGIRAKELVAQLLTFSHRRETATEAISVAPIVKEVAKLLRSTMPSSISIDAGIAAGLPEVLISPVQLHQVLMNLGVNARDAISGKGSIEITAATVDLDEVAACVSCHQTFSGGYLTLAVRDTGHGIAPDHVLKIFDPFFTTKEVGRGSGLGLSVLHGIVHSANGHIGLRSVPGKGTEFRVYLPAHAAHTGRVVRELKPDSANVAVRGHILVVDDEAAIVGFVTVLLENLGCRVTGLTSATEALRLFQDDPHGIDMVITDQTMPELTGAELARAMLARRPELPIVLSTGYSNAIDEDMARQIGIRRFLIKPVPAQVFADIVAEYLALKG